ncbi:T9SS type B sorting domain-containing protein [Flavobacterium channae]|uniref:T9SS type B sorting domain-containing protein n=1 Tax=Flavobacterium channae TaxID=2897181 RepID=UPI001E544F3C|nr:T9SS type B sorting domain-containing protein [Flavobacterium channae]UGS23234.1 T9SS type B sorting domain-containing protein [Flavobacterium channae]
MMKKTVSILLICFLFLSYNLYSQGGASSCAQLAANPTAYQSCATNVPFSSSVGGNSESFNSSCIPTQYVGPTWFFIEIDTPGNVVLQISQRNLSGVGTDVDFVLWGPFQNLNNICSQLIPANEVDCSYLPDAVETVNIPNSSAGDLYVIVIDNYSGQPGNITVSQTGGTGSTNCDFLSSVTLNNTDGSLLTTLDYCKPDTKEIVATIDITDFPGSPSNLRFNYTWYKDGVQISTVSNSTSATNSITVTESGIYKVVTTAYDITVNPSGNTTGLRESEATADLKFHVKPDVSITNTNTVCLNTNPILSSTIINNADLDSTVDVLNYQWYRNNVLVNGATTNSFTPTLPGDYFVRVSNLPCSVTDSNVIRIIANPNVQISSNTTICENDSYTITSSNTNAGINSGLSYQWFKDGVAILGATNAAYIVNKFNQALNTTSQYYLETTEQGTCNNISNTVSITINAQPIINTALTTLEQCDYINNTLDGIAETNLLQLYNYFTNNTPGLTLYFYSDIALTQLINNPSNYINTSSPFTQNIYVKAVNENVVPNCTSAGIGNFVLQINPTSVANYPDIPAVCPELNQNFGFINFDAQRVLIKNTYFPSSDVSISFHLTTSDASTGLNGLTNASQIPVGTTLIYTRVISNTTQSCEGIGTFNVVVIQAPLQNTINNESLCLLDSYLLNSKDGEALAGQNPTVVASYFNTFDNARDNVLVINKNVSLPLTLGTRTIFVRLFDSLTGCFSVVSSNITVFPNPTIIQPSPIRHCGDTTAAFDLNSRINQITNGNTNYQVTFYANNADLVANNPIATPDSYTSATATIICKVVDPTNFSCAATTTLNLVVMSLPGSNSNPTPIELCNDSGFEYFDLTTRELQMAGATPVNTIAFRYYKELVDALANGNANRISNPNNFLNTTINFQKIYVRLNSRTNIDSETGESCFKILELDLHVRPYPFNHLLNEPYTICIDQLNNITYPVEIKTQLNSTDYIFQWFNGHDAIPGNEISGETNSSFVTSTVGLYSVQVTNISNAANCSSIFNLSTANSIVPNSLTITPDELIAFDTENTVTAIVAPASPDYLYSIDGTYFQESNVFTNIPGGDYTLTVINKFGCGVLTETFTIVDYPNYFTPNGDGHNDTWNIKGSAALDAAVIRIFDRYGKLMKQIDPNGNGWDGTFNNKPLPSTDYWFTIEYTKDNVTKEFKGHFSLIR